MRYRVQAKPEQSNRGWYDIQFASNFWFIEICIDGQEVIRRYRFGWLRKLLGKPSEERFFLGKIAEVQVWKEQQITSGELKELKGTETSLLSYFKLNGDFKDGED